jgi:hypothetical protein
MRTGVGPRRPAVLGVVLLSVGIGFAGVAGVGTLASSTGLGAASAAAERVARVSLAFRGAAPRTARSSHVLDVKDEGHLHSVRNSGSELTEEGPVSGTIPGRVRANFNIGATIYATFTIYANRGGSISGRGKGALHSTSVYSTFGGSLTVIRGTGRYAHAHGDGGLYGAINRKTYALTVQALGTLYY